MRLLGAVLAGGRSRRFGSDKGQAEIDGTALLQRVCNALASQCERVCVVGRTLEGYASAPDRPEPGLGPLGGVLGALLFARDNRFDEVLTSALDIPDLPPDLAERLAPAPAFVADQPVVGRWRVGDIPALEQLLSPDGPAIGSASMRAFCAACDA
ncbi:MAG: NTP transferase domain-containing protein, partial [Erythrobacter sp.]|nr:NTP transferase domain-containing protein [Erythrobacter sp.]